jgi:outer membrane receptor protein involved in Fe transport
MNWIFGSNAERSRLAVTVKELDQQEMEAVRSQSAIKGSSKNKSIKHCSFWHRERLHVRPSLRLAVRFMSVYAVVVALLLSGSTLSFGDDADKDNEGQKHLTLEEIVIIVTAVPDPTAIEVGARKIEQGKNVTIPDVIKAEPDIDLKRRALIGDTTDNMSIRGFSGNRIMLNIDGRPVNAAGVVGGYYIDWGTIPLDNIERIELIRGGSSVRYGNNALGGVINVVTKRPTGSPTLSLWGNYGGGDGLNPIQNYRAAHTYKIGPFGYSVAGSYQKADDFLWNNDFEGKNLAASLFLDMPLRGLATFGFQYANSKRGFIRENRLSDNPDDPAFHKKINPDYPLSFGEEINPYSGSAFMPGPGANWNKTKYYFDFGYSQPIHDALLDFRFYKNFEDRREKNYSSSDVNYFYPDGELVLDRDVASDRSYGASLELHKPLRNHELLTGLEYKVLAYGDTDTNRVDLTYNNAPWVTPGSLSYKASSEGIAWGYYVQDTWRISDRWLLTGGFRYDHYTNKSINGSTLPELKDDALTPKFAATYKIADSDTITASLYQAVRTPGLPETYWWAEGATHGEQVLKPEKNSAAELLYRHDFSKAKFLRMSAYYYNVDDYIMFRFDPNWRGAYNIDNAKIYGLSVDGRTNFADWISGNAAMTWQRSKKGEDIYDTARLSDEIDYLPEWKVGGGLEFILPHRSLLNVAVRWVGERRTIYAYSAGWPAQQYFRLVKLDPYVTADINLKIPLGEYFEFNGYVENLFNRKYEEQFGYPMPGIIAGGALKLIVAR